LRRLTVAEPVSRAAVWSRWLAVFALAVTGVAIILSRAHGADPPAVLTVFAASLIIAGFAAMLAGAAALVIWRDGVGGAGQAFLGFALAAALIVYPAYLAGIAFLLPKIHDVSTDLASPPPFLISTKARAARGGVEPPPLDDATRAAVRQAYPDLDTVKVEMDSTAAYRLALSVADDLHWRIVDTQPPNLAGDGSALIEATDQSRFFAFPSDIAIRIRPRATTTAIDLRSVSRVGGHDFGANAARVRKFLAAVKDAASER
jgi:uncharacterized protein (DUF1499 family)